MSLQSGAGFIHFPGFYKYSFNKLSGLKDANVFNSEKTKKNGISIAVAR